MANQSLQVGDTVQLNSGGPVMTVKNVSNSIVKCIYFDTNTQDFKSQEFLVNMLSKVILA